MNNGIDSLTLKMLDKISEITITKYDYDNIDDLYCMLEDLLYKYEDLETEFEDYKRDIEDNYIPRYKDKYDEYGVSKSDFY